MQYYGWNLVGLVLLVSSYEAQETPSTETVDAHAIFTKPVTEGVYKFDENGFIPKEPIERIRKLHKEMIQTIQNADYKKQAQYLLTLSNRANTDVTRLKQKMIDELGSTTILEIDKTKVKADAFILLTSHAALLSNLIVYFPDTMSSLIKKNPEFEETINWVVKLVTTHNITEDTVLLKLFKLVQQELGLIPKDPNYVNPYKKTRKLYDEPPTTTKKPRKKLPRGPRMSRGEL